MNVGKMVVRIGTHSGTFHCDEALACFMLKSLPRYQDAEIVRSRDPAVLSTCDVVVDVGGEFDAARHRYDHHQRDFAHTMASLGKGRANTKLSSAGLVYAHFGEEVVKTLVGSMGAAVEEESVALLYDKLYERFMEEIDAVDNGIPQTDEKPRYAVTTTLSGRVGSLNPSWNAVDPPPQDEAFRSAMALTGAELTDRLRYLATSWLPARDAVHKAVKNRMQVDGSGALVVLEQGGLPWKDHLFALEAEDDSVSEGQMKYVLYADEAAKWRVQAIPVSAVEGFKSRLALPSAWRGLRDAALTEASGIAGGIFVHASGFIGGNATKDGALAMARKALDIAQ